MILNYISLMIIPIIIGIIIAYGFFEKLDVFDLFVQGANEGIKIVLELFPVLLGLFFAIGLLNNSNFLNFLSNIISNITNKLYIPSELLPLIFIRPISGSGAVAMATEIMKQYGPDSIIGIMASIIMGSTETTFYVYTLYMSKINVKKTRGIIIASIIADIIGILSSIYICSIFI